MTANPWPFGTDADRDDPLTKLRIPVVTSFNPSWKYVAAYIDVDTGPYSWGSTERPTDAEAQMIASFIQEYIQNWFNERYQHELAERLLDVDSGCNTTVFIKYGPDDWAYRHCSWIYGPTFVPLPPNSPSRDGDPLSLVQVMDRTHGMHTDYPSKRWAEWKAAHPEVFGS
ncbi:hypothetical protein ABT010_13160 [Streptomyces sp. NPDC002668]|uniref:hypothetical protein n=1 Tax=Streptomyces sp. NPDC002668 TaxID=3154422 RepID=UPI0033267005